MWNWMSMILPIFSVSEMRRKVEHVEGQGQANPLSLHKIWSLKVQL